MLLWAERCGRYDGALGEAKHMAADPTFGKYAHLIAGGTTMGSGTGTVH